MSSAYLRLLIFLLVILIPACDLSSLAFRMMYSVCRLKAGGERDDRGWDGWMASSTRRTWVRASSGSGWWTGKPVVLQSMGWQRVVHDWAVELNWTELIPFIPRLTHTTFLHLISQQHRIFRSVWFCVYTAFYLTIILVTPSGPPIIIQDNYLFQDF